jgi:hypothetical protein
MRWRGSSDDEAFHTVRIDFGQQRKLRIAKAGPTGFKIGCKNPSAQQRQEAPAGAFQNPRLAANLFSVIRISMQFGFLTPSPLNWRLLRTALNDGTRSRRSCPRRQ